MSKTKASLILLAAAVTLLNNAAGAQETGAKQRPGLIVSDSQLPPLRLKSHIVEVQIQGRIARVIAESVYQNKSNRDVEATYVFPLPEGATIDKFTMWMDGEAVVAQIAEKERAASTYHSIVARRKDPGLLEQLAENLFQFRIYPVKANGEQKVRVEYSHILPLNLDGPGLMFSYPLQTDTPREPSSRVARDFALSVRFETENEIDSVQSPTHKIAKRIDKDNPRKGSVSLEQAFAALDTDFRLNICFKQQAATVSTLAYRAGDGRHGDGTFLIFINPLLQANETLPNKDLVLVMDISGSMAGRKFEQAREALREGLKRLRPGDHFNIITFSDCSNMLSEQWLDVTPDNLKRAAHFISRLDSGGGTNIGEALDKALALGGHPGFARLIVFATDGLPTVGERETPVLVKRSATKDAGPAPRFYTVGIGYDVNTLLLDRIAEQSSGDRAYVTEDQQIDSKIASLCDKIATPLMSDVKLEFSKNLQVEQLYPNQIKDLYIGRQVVLSGRYKNPGTGTLLIRGKRGEREVAIEASIVLPEQSGEATADIPKQWAMRKVGYLLDQMRLHGSNDELVGEVRQLGLRHHIVTPYTSYLALEKEDQKKWDEEARRRQQIAAVPMPPASGARSGLNPTHDTTPSDPNRSEGSALIVPPNILAKAELGDHWESQHPDRIDSHSALGNPDLSLKGSDEPSDGSGFGETTFHDAIGIGGSGTPGSGSGWGGGDGSGAGVDSGSGRGAFGSRNGGGRRLFVKRYGGSRATEHAVDRALRWLAFHQEADGHWDSLKYAAARKSDTAATALALMAFLSAGHTEKVGEYKDNVRRAIAWLIGKQKDNGLLLDDSDQADADPGYAAALATLALSEAASMGRSAETRAAAQKAVDYCVNIHRQKGNAWGPSAGSDARLSSTGWFIMALKSAKSANLKVDPEAFESACAFLDKVESKTVGADGDSLISRYSDRAGQKPTAYFAALGNLSRVMMGWKHVDLQSSVELMIKDGGYPNWDLESEKCNLSYWYVGTLCAFQQGGNLWKIWNESMKKALLDNQYTQGDDIGSWPTVGDGENGRVAQTAMACLCLEVYYRYGLQRDVHPTVPRAPALPIQDRTPVLTPVEPPPINPTPKVPTSESGKDAVDYSEWLNQLKKAGE